jgi:hypothetical protein
VQIISYVLTGAACYGGYHVKTLYNYWRKPGTLGLCKSESHLVTLTRSMMEFMYHPL